MDHFLTKYFDKYGGFNTPYYWYIITAGVTYTFISTCIIRKRKKNLKFGELTNLFTCGIIYTAILAKFPYLAIIIGVYTFGNMFFS